MKNGWQKKALGEVCTMVQDGAHESPKRQFSSPGEGRYPYITSKNIRNNYLDLEDVSYVEEDFHNRIYPRCNPSVGDVLLTKDGANTGNVTLNTLDEPFSLLSSVCLIKTKPSALLPAFLSYYIQSPDGLASITGQMTGAAIKRIILRDIKLAEIPLPPLPEQQRIVGLLDAAFAGIATAKANAEQNLRNARALFASHLQSVFEKPGKGWVEKSLGETCEMYQPQTISMKDLVEDGEYPVFGANGIIGRYDKFNHEESQLLITCRGATCGAVNVSEPKSWITGNAMVVRPKDQAVNLQFLEYYFRGGIDISTAITGAAQPQITRTNLSPLLIRFPKSVAEQKRLAEQFVSLAEGTQLLESIYRQKLGALEELKKALLHRAFAGDL